MTCNTITNIQILKEPGAVFASAISSEAVKLDNYKYIDFIVTSGAGTAADITVTIESSNDGTNYTTLPFKKKNSNVFSNVEKTGDTLSIGGVAGSAGNAIYRIIADDLAQLSHDRVRIKTTAAVESEVNGAIIAILYEPRYSQQ